MHGRCYVLAAAIYYQTQGLILTRITADGIRRDGITSLEVIDLGFAESKGDVATVAPPPRVPKPFPIQVVAA